MKSDESPCKACDRKDEDKRGCSKICARLEAWQDGDPQWETFRVPTPEELGEAGGGHQKTDQKICKHDGCDDPVRCRGFCLMHYDLWRSGKLPEYPPFEIIRTRNRKEAAPKKTKKAARKTTVQLPISKTMRSQAATGAAEHQFIINLTDYPAMWAVILETASLSMVTPQHVIVSLIGEALAARPRRPAGALKQS